MDAFFVSVEEVLNPALRGKPVIVGGDPAGRGVVCSASYKAREYGVRSAMPMARARRLCPRAVFLRGSSHVYSEFSGRVMDILKRYSPALEQVSVDEAYLDMTGLERLHRADPVTVAQRIHDAIRGEVGVPASVGIGSGKLIAKIAANAAKPNGVMMIRPGYEASFLAPLPIGRMPGVGPSTEKELKKMGIRLIGDLSGVDRDLLRRAFGKHGEVIAGRARGEDARGVMSGFETGADGGEGGRTLSREVTYAEDTEDPERMRATLSYLSESVGRRLRKGGLSFRGVTLKLRYSDFRTVTRSRAFARPSNDTGDIFRTACELLDRLLIRRARVRLVGVGVTTADAAAQLDLFRQEAAPDAIHRGMDRVRDRFGFEAALLARSRLHGAGRSGARGEEKRNPVFDLKANPA